MVNIETIKTLMKLDIFTILKYAEIKSLKGYSSSYCYNYPYRAQIEVTNKCNLACIICPRKDELKKMHDKKPENMAFDKYKTIIDQLKNLRILHVFGRGEPLMHPEIFEMIKYAKKISIPFVSITTNGILLNKEKAGILASTGIDELRVSIDGPDEKTYKKIRNADFNMLKKNIKYFTSISDVPVRVNFVLNRINYDTIINMPTLVKELGCVELYVSVVTEHKNVSEENIQIIYEGKEKEILINRMKEEAQKSGIRLTMAKEQSLKECYSPFINAFIEIGGYLTPCCRLEDIRLDNVVENGFWATWNEKKIRSWRKKVAQCKFPAKCREVKCIDELIL